MSTLEAWVSPLGEVERAAQERAKATNLDPAHGGGHDNGQSRGPVRFSWRSE